MKQNRIEVIAKFLGEIFTLLLLCAIKSLIAALILMAFVDVISDITPNVPELNLTYWNAFKGCLFLDSLVNMFFVSPFKDKSNDKSGK